MNFQNIHECAVPILEIKKSMGAIDLTFFTTFLLRKQLTTAHDFSVVPRGQR